jgi:hypothetical protein
VWRRKTKTEVQEGNMSLAAKLWNRAMDRIISENTGHDFIRMKPGHILCQNGCGKSCLEVVDELNQGKLLRCSNEPKDKQSEEASPNRTTEGNYSKPDQVVVGQESES